MADDAHRTTVGDYVTLVRGTTYKGALVGEPGPALLGLGSIEPGGGFRIGNYKTYGGDCPEELMLFPCDIYASLKGATKDGKMIGSVARVPTSVSTGRLTQDTVKLVFRDRDPVAETYPYWVLRTPQYRDYCAGRAMGSAVVALSRRDFLSYPVPPLTTQRRKLVELFDVIDEKIELNRRMNETLEAMARALFKSWFVDFDPVRAKAEGSDPALPKHPADLFPDSFEDSELGEIPKGWETRSLYETAEFINGAAFQSKDFCDPSQGLPVVKIAELKGGISAQTRFSERLLDAKQVIDTGELLYSWSGSPETSLDAFLWTKGRGLLNQHIFKVVTPTIAEKRFVYYLLKFLRLTFIEMARNKQTTGLGHITVADMKRLYVCSPAQNVLAAFDNQVGPLFDRAFKSTVQNQTLVALRDTLLPKLVSGEIRIDSTKDHVGLDRKP
jgi:type I restriction enzyme S subunit